MGCSNDWIITGHTKTIQNTEIELKGIHENCTLIICNITFPWKKTLYLRQFDITNNLVSNSETYYNPENSLEYVIITIIDTWCTTTGNAVEIEVCHKLPPECPIPICNFIIS